MKDVQCYELFGGIALKNHAFSFFIFKEKLNQQDWNNCNKNKNNCNDLHESCDSFLGVLHGLCDECFPIRNIHDIKKTRISHGLLMN